APPAGLVSVEVCSPTGLLPGPDCAEPVREWFIAGTEPQVRESYYSRGVDGKITIDPPVEARAWAVEAGLPLPDAAARGAAAVHIVQPAPSSVLYLSPELAEQAVLLKASGP